MKSELFNDLLISAQEMIAIEKGQKTPEKHHTHSSKPDRLHNAGVTGSSPVIATTNSKAREACKYFAGFFVLRCSESLKPIFSFDMAIISKKRLNISAIHPSNLG